MTQMLLFDAATANTAVAPVVSVAPVSASSVLADSGESSHQETKPTETHTPGVNRMGDLARLVLLRHDLVAARRAKRLAK